MKLAAYGVYNRLKAQGNKFLHDLAPLALRLIDIPYTLYLIPYTTFICLAGDQGLYDYIDQLIGDNNHPLDTFFSDKTPYPFILEGLRLHLLLPQ